MFPVYCLLFVKHRFTYFSSLEFCPDGRVNLWKSDHQGSLCTVKPLKLRLAYIFTIYTRSVRWYLASVILWGEEKGLPCSFIPPLPLNFCSCPSFRATKHQLPNIHVCFFTRLLFQRRFCKEFASHVMPAILVCQNKEMEATLD